MSSHTRHIHAGQRRRDESRGSLRTRDAFRLRALLAVPTAAVVVALIGPPLAAATTSPVGPAPATSQGIIMRDGGVCDPIRHMGC